MVTLALNVSTRKFVPWQGSLAKLDTLMRGNQTFRIYLRDNDPDGIQPHIAYDPNADGIDGILMGIWPTTPGTEANVVAFSDQTEFTYNTDDADNPYFQGDFNTLTDEMADWLDGEASKEAYFGIYLAKGTGTIAAYDYRDSEEPNITVQNQTYPGAGQSINMLGELPRDTYPRIAVKGNITWLFDLNESGDVVASKM